MAVGHRPPVTLTPRDEKLFRAFQSNLLSLISHELRTPLMGILNSLGLLSDGDPEGISQAELIRMARQNAQRLHRTLAALLDLAAVESNTFHVRLREAELFRIVKSRIEESKNLLSAAGLKIDLETDSARGAAAEDSAVPLLADPQKLGRAIELCLEVLSVRAKKDEALKLRISSTQADFRFKLQPGAEQSWESAWLQAQAGLQGGVASSVSAFAGVLQSEEKFLSRAEEGLGSELLIIHEIMRLHSGKVIQSRNGEDVLLSLVFPKLSSEEGVRAVLASRSYGSASDLGSVVLAIVGVPKGNPVHGFRAQVKQALFRSTDAVYSLPERNQLALVLDDCKPEDAPNLLERLKTKMGQNLKFGVVHFPADGLDPEQLLKLAEKRLSRANATRSTN